jgi:hypothetical protein
MVKMCHVPLVEAPLTAIQLPQLGLTFWDRKDRGTEDAQSIISAKISVPNHLYTCCYEKQLTCECPQNDACCQL